MRLLPGIIKCFFKCYLLLKDSCLGSPAGFCKKLGEQAKNPWATLQNRSGLRYNIKYCMCAAVFRSYKIKESQSALLEKGDKER